MNVVDYKGLFYHIKGYLDCETVIDFSLSSLEYKPKVGDIYLGKIEHYDLAQHIYYVFLSHGLYGYLKSDKLHSTINAQNKYAVGDDVYVQITAESEGDKQAKIEGIISLKSDNMVLVTDESGLKISHKIKDKYIIDLLKLKLSPLIKPHFGIVVRTSAQDIDSSLIETEAILLIKQFENLIHHKNKVVKERLLYRKVPSRLVEDKPIERYLTNDVSDVLLPQSIRVKALDALFRYVDIEAQIKARLSVKKQTSEGANYFIEELEALTIVDVNSSKYQKKTLSKDFAYHLNYHVMHDIIADLLKRNISGIVLIDFINMTHVQASMFLDKIKALLPKGKIQIKGFTRTGLLEMTIKRTKASLMKTCFYSVDVQRYLKPKLCIDIMLDKLVYWHITTETSQFYFDVSPDIMLILEEYKQAVKEKLIQYNINIWLNVLKSGYSIFKPSAIERIDSKEKKTKSIDLLMFI